MRKFILAFIVILTMVFLSSAIMFAADKKAEDLKGQLNILMWLPDAPEIVQQWAEGFMKKYPNVKVDYQMQTGNAISENLQPKIASNSLPDVFSQNNDAFGHQLADEGLEADIGDTQAWKNQYDSMKSGWTSAKNGVKFGINGGIASTMIYYNVAMFKKAGISAVPKNWEEFITVCEKLKKANIVPLVWYGGFPNMLGNGPFSYGFAQNVALKDPDFQKKINDGSFNFDTPAVADIFEKMKIIGDKYANKGFMSTDYLQGIQLFVDGKAAMIFQGSWVAASFLGKDAKFDTGVFMPPWNAKGTSQMPVLGSETGWSIANNDNQKLSKAFLDYIAGEGFSIYQNRRQNVPGFIKNVGKVILDNKIKNFIDAANKAPKTCQLYFQVLPPNLLGSLFTLMQEVMNGTKTSAEAAKELNEAYKNN